MMLSFKKKRDSLSVANPPIGFVIKQWIVTLCKFFDGPELTALPNNPSLMHNYKMSAWLDRQSWIVISAGIELKYQLF